MLWMLRRMCTTKNVNRRVVGQQRGRVWRMGRFGRGREIVRRGNRLRTSTRRHCYGYATPSPAATARTTTTTRSNRWAGKTGERRTRKDRRERSISSAQYASHCWPTYVHGSLVRRGMPKAVASTGRQRVAIATTPQRQSTTANRLCTQTRGQRVLQGG
jgi:hypothetical protein